MPELLVLTLVWIASAAGMTVREARKGSRVLAGQAVVFALLGPLAVLALVIQRIAQPLWAPFERAAEWRGRHGTSTNAGRSDGLPGI